MHWKGHDDGTVLFQLGACLQVMTATPWAGSVQGKKAETASCPMNSIHKTASPTGNHCQVQMNSHILHTCLCFHLPSQRSTYGLDSYQYDMSRPLWFPEKYNAQPHNRKTTTQQEGKNSIALGLLNKPTKTRKFKVKFYTPSLTPHYCEREIKVTKHVVGVQCQQ